ncbi:MAG: hypothetical protein WD294_13865 [Phycisphaeraceae bacterium]
MVSCARLLIPLLALMGVMLPLAAAVADESAAQRRIVHRFHFNEEELGNFESMPMNWFRVTGPGFPRYTDIGFDQRFATAGETSLKLQLNGGSAALTLASGTIAVMPDAQYLLTAQVRTADAVHARARLTAVFLDRRNQPLLNTRTRSPLIASDNRWTPIQFELPRTPEQAAWLVLRVELLQPAEFRTTSLSKHEVVEQDIDAAAWFDDITLYQLPRIELTTQSASNVIRRPNTPRLSASVQDLTGDSLDARLSVYDQAGDLVGRDQRTLDGSQPGQWEFTPDLPRLGWYWAELEVRSEGTLIGHARTAVSYLPQMTGRGSSESDRFMILLEGVPGTHRHLVPDIMAQLGDQAVLVNLWRSEMTQRDLTNATDKADPLVMQLINQGRSVALSLAEVPQELALSVGVDVDNPLALFAQNGDAWEANLMAVFALYGHLVDQWHIGGIDNTHAFFRDDLPQVHNRARSLLRRYVADPKLALPWRATHELTPPSRDLHTLLIDLPASIRPAQIPDYLESWTDHPARKTIHLRPIPAADHAHADRATDLAMRMINAWQHRPDRLALSHPWRHAPGPPASVMPDPLLGVWVNVAEQLAGRRFVGDINLGPGIKAHLLDGPGGGVLVAWNESSGDAEASLDLYLGNDPVAVDIYGNRTELQREGDRQTLKLTQSPQFIENVNMQLARLRAGFNLDEPFIDSVHSRHERTLQLANPWPRTISGRMRVTGPERWDIQPQMINFSIPAGQTLDIPITLTFPISEFAGPKRLTVDLQIEADRNYELELAAPMMVGLENVEFHATASTEAQPDGEPADAVVTIVVTNLGEREQTFYAFAMAPEHPRAERIISRLEPGQTIVRRFRFPAAGPALTGKSIRVGLRQADGPAMLNDLVQVP